MVAVLLVGSLLLHRGFEKRVVVVVPGKLIRGAWQRPEPLRRIIAREGIRTIVTLTAINRDDPKFVDQQSVICETGVTWLVVPMRGSRATPEQMALAADLLADPSRQPVFFHCVAGHHRTNLAHAAYLIRHCGDSAAEAWSKLTALPWTAPERPADQDDRFLIEEFSRIQRSLAPESGRGVWEVTDANAASPDGPAACDAVAARPGGTGWMDRLEPGPP
jgi:protein tyrosine phosphatase (PTP) superfamily phosphohydrolase (DUF442 family)